ncbi:hypothetical protein FQN53_007446 [Emmonsiellopsis sp. PD_33]|nr:hypothetical protein FQN53_007446 [Emmonsiellopsis sp. PD_33]
MDATVLDGQSVSQNSTESKKQESPNIEKSVIDSEGEEAQHPLDQDQGVMKDGIRLHPQPTSDPLDPLNWSSLQKHSILAIVMIKYFLFTYVTTTTVPTFPEIQTQFNISFAQVNWTVAIPALGLAVGPLFWSSFSDIYGRRSVFILGTVIALVATVGAAVAENYGGYMAARFFQGFGVSPGATVGMAVVGDLFFDYERGQKLGLWVLAIDSGLLLGPTIGGFMAIVSAAWINWLTAILFGVLLVLEIFFMPETLYPRNVMLSRMPPASGSPGQADIEKMGVRQTVAEDVGFPRTKELAFFNFKPVPGMRHPKPWDSLVRFAKTFKLGVVSIGVFGYCFLWYWWVLSIITMIPAAYVDYSPQIQGLLFLGLLVGTLVAEVFFSGRLSDWIVTRLAKRNNNIRVAEMRLWLMYPSMIVSAIGLFIWGVSIDRAYHWMVGQVAFFLFAGGIQVGNMTITSYIIDAYPLQSMSVITFYSVFLNLSAFIDPFFIAPWQATAGWTWTFAGHGLITTFAGIPLFALLHKYGARIRGASPHPSWVNPEFDSRI